MKAPSKNWRSVEVVVHVLNSLSAVDLQQNVKSAHTLLSCSQFFNSAMFWPPMVFFLCSCTCFVLDVCACLLTNATGLILLYFFSLMSFYGLHTCMGVRVRESGGGGVSSLAFALCLAPFWTWQLLVNILSIPFSAVELHLLLLFYLSFFLLYEIHLNCKQTLIVSTITLSSMFLLFCHFLTL